MFHVVTSGGAWLETDESRRDIPASRASSRSCRTARDTFSERAGAPAPGLLELAREQVSDRYEILRTAAAARRRR